LNNNIINNYKQNHENIPDSFKNTDKKYIPDLYKKYTWFMKNTAANTKKLKTLSIHTQCSSPPDSCNHDIILECKQGKPKTDTPHLLSSVFSLCLKKSKIK